MKNLQELQRNIAKGQEFEYAFFWGPFPKDGKYSPFSQWYKSDFTVDGETYCCMEQYMMAAKATLFGDAKARALIMMTNNPKDIKALGRQVRNFNDKMWMGVMREVVIKGNYHKFIQNAKLKDLLMSTGDMVLVEASPFDKRWGIGMKADDPNADNPLKWRGENVLGFALMEVRSMIKNSPKTK